jgi:hypothetical protein
MRRRLRLDLYRSVRDRRLADVPEKDAQRPGLALLAEQGKDYERTKFKELEDVLPDLIVRGALKGYEADEDRAFETIERRANVRERRLRSISAFDEDCVTTAPSIG